MHQPKSVGDWGILFFAVASQVGLAICFVLAGLVGWIDPIWWGGEELLFPLVFGAGTLLFGTIPFYLLVRGISSASTRNISIC